MWMSSSIASAERLLIMCGWGEMMSVIYPSLQIGHLYLIELGCVLVLCLDLNLTF